MGFEERYLRPLVFQRRTATTTIRFLLLCALWYTSSALSSNTGKTILGTFRYPVTLTFVQFAFVATYSLIFILSFSTLKYPNISIIKNTLPMGLFQVAGHISSSMAISRIPVSTVHTIKALSPLFTVASYVLLFQVTYSIKTYIALFPLTIGVMLACSFDLSASNAIGLLCAFASALVFVSSNIFFKRILPSSSSHHSKQKLDKLNLLFYSSTMAFILMIPIWIYYDLKPLLLSSSYPSISYHLFLNGTVHFAQNMIAFVILASTSPVTYSIASLIKRVAVICIAILWFNQSIHPIQAFGIALTFAGLYLYNNAKADIDNGEKKMLRIDAARQIILPTTLTDARILKGIDSPPPETVEFAPGAETSAIKAHTRLDHHHHHHPPYPSPPDSPPKNITSIT